MTPTNGGDNRPHAMKTSSRTWYRDNIEIALLMLEGGRVDAARRVLAGALVEPDRLPKRPCEVCDESYQPVRRDQRYCGAACRSEAITSWYVPVAERRATPKQPTL